MFSQIFLRDDDDDPEAAPPNTLLDFVEVLLVSTTRAGAGLGKMQKFNKALHTKVP